MKKLKLFFSRLFTTFALLAYCMQCFAVIIVDVDICYKPISFMIDNYNKKNFDRSIRVLEYDSDVNKINFIHYYPYGHRVPSFQHDYRDFFIEYDGNTQSFNVTPKPDTTTWIRSLGRINSLRTENLGFLDETRYGYSLLKQSPVPDYSSTLEKTINYLNYFDLPLKAKQALKGQKQWRKMHRQFNIVYAVEGQQLYYPIAWENIHFHEFGDIGELACDLTMMILGFKKNDAKYDGNQGIDGFYTKEDIVIVAEAKMWKNDGTNHAPDLDTIDRTHLTPKFNRSSKGAVVKIEIEKPEIYAHIVNAHVNRRLHSIPFGVLPDGIAYMRMEAPLNIAF